jgi:signal peptidase II
VTVSVAAIVFIIVIIRKIKDRAFSSIFSLSLILSGAIGNLIDRVRYGEVIDFLDFHLGPHHWPAFNIADSAISIGAVILILELIKRKDII